MTAAEREERIMKKYNELKDKRTRLEERKAMYLEELKNDFGIETEEELDLAIKKADKDMDKLTARLEPMLDKLEKDLGIC